MCVIMLFDKILFQIQSIADKLNYNLDSNKLYQKVCNIITEKEMKLKGLI